jgi:hypothetical protein
MEIKPIETVSMVYYVMAQHIGLFLLLRETKSPYLRDMFEYVEEFQDSIRYSKGVHMKTYFETFHVHQQEDYPHVSYFDHEDIEYESDLEQQQGSSKDNEERRFSLVPIYDDY